MREFNTSGPNILVQHYTLSRLDLIEKGKELVYMNRYFTIPTSGETGKSTYFRLLSNALQKDGYSVCHINFGNYIDAPLSVFMERLVLALEKAWDIDLANLNLSQVFHKVEQVKDKKLVLIIDEVEGINPQYFGEFLHTLRNAYHSRETHAARGFGA